MKNLWRWEENVEIEIKLNGDYGDCNNLSLDISRPLFSKRRILIKNEINDCGKRRENESWKKDDGKYVCNIEECEKGSPSILLENLLD